MKKITIFLSVLLSVFILAGCGGKKEKLEWPDNKLTKLIPKPDAKYAEVETYDESLDVTVHKQSPEQFKSYVKEVKKKGFDNDAVDENDSMYTTYEAYDKKGNSIELSYDKKKKIYTIDLELSKVSDKYTWPSIGMATLIPKPDSDYGKITSDSSDYFTIYVGKTSRQDYEKYINKVVEKGFNIDHSKYKNSFEAKDSKGNKIDIYYKGFKTMKIDMYAPDEDEDTSDEEATTQSSSQSEQTQPSQQSTQQTNTTGIRPEVKEQIDAYEKFFDEYVAFMKKYKDSNNAVSMAADYAKFMKKYTEYTQKFENIDDKGWNDAEVAYWLEVNGRVMGKLATIQ